MILLYSFVCDYIITVNNIRPEKIVKLIVTAAALNSLLLGIMFSTAHLAVVVSFHAFLHL
jgi:hypothetical protein